MRYLVTIIALFFLLTSINYSQDVVKSVVVDTVQSKEIRKIFIYSGVGTFDNVSGGIGYQFDEKYSLSLKASSTISPPDFLVMGSAIGLGPRFSIHYNNNSFNVISFEILPYISMNNIIYNNNGFLKGAYLALGVGHEDVKELGLCFYYNAGLGLTTSSEGSSFRVLLRFGVNFNFYDGFK